ncbi:HAD-IB family hydrolase [Microlunatus panaciterrae]|uniref:HAD superfamily hydrolase (TIGR01490 family) n=1 Tax=Microlunatus panaciterrae TaxID=400768 RepID=A0ABS2RJP7_9ACTN|nr:HAD superfamily hydrolase (TIGR01490 family) [Microlunatus panaciterrae]
MGSAAFFDLDKTIIARASVLAFAGPLYEAQLLTRRHLTRSAYAQFAFATGRADHTQMEKMRTYLSAMVAGWNTTTLRRVVKAHLAQIVSPLVYAEAVELIRQHQLADRDVIIVTSTGADLAEPIGALLGVDHVLSTRMVERDDSYTGEIADYMYGERKAEAIRELAAERGYDLEASYAYSDSGTDQPMLAVVGHPHAVNPDRDLRRIAAASSWPILEFRRAPVFNPGRDRSQLIMTFLAVGLVGVAIAFWMGRRRGIEETTG